MGQLKNATAIDAIPATKKTAPSKLGMRPFDLLLSTQNLVLSTSLRTWRFKNLGDYPLIARI